MAGGASRNASRKRLLSITLDRFLLLTFQLLLFGPGDFLSAQYRSSVHSRMGLKSSKYLRTMESPRATAQAGLAGI